MKITSFNPLIATKDPESVVQLFEELGFERRHQKKGISDQDITGVRMKNADGFYVDVATGEFPQDRMLIRMNVDNMEEAVELLTAHGFRRVQEFDDTVETPTSRFNIMISPSDFIFNVIQHKK
jgi:hypothetical protein